MGLYQYYFAESALVYRKVAKDSNYMKAYLQKILCTNTPHFRYLHCGFSCVHSHVNRLVGDLHLLTVH